MARSAMKIDLVVVDMQNSFMGEDDGSPMTETVIGGDLRSADRKVKDLNAIVNIAELAVKGGTTAARNTARLIDEKGHRFHDISNTLDSHRRLHSAHPYIWMDAKGNPPAPFTTIKADDLKNGVWRLRIEDPEFRKQMLKYLVDLEATTDILHTIWNPHCIVGTWGHNVQRDLNEAFARWEIKQRAAVEHVTKGNAIIPEHFGAVEAQVPDPNDPSTQPNMPFISRLGSADILAFAGLALDYCVRRTIEQVYKHLGKDAVKKFVILTDCTAAIFPDAGDKFLKEMQSLGATLTTSDKFLAA